MASDLSPEPVPHQTRTRTLKRPRPRPGTSTDAEAPTITTRPAYPRKRAAQACLACRRRRVKCDNERPDCTSCLSLGIECVYHEADKSSFDAASLAILQRLDGLETLVKTALPAHVLPAAMPNTQGCEAHHRGDEANALAEDLSSSYCINVEAVLAWPVLGFDTTLSEAQVQLKRLLRTSNPNPGPSPALTMLRVEADAAEALLQRFLEHIHIYNPVLEVERIQQSIRFTVHNGLGWDASTCLLLLIFALGSVSDRPIHHIYPVSAAFRHSEQFSRGEAFFMAAQRRMGPLLCNSGIIEAQIFFLAGVYLMITIRPIEAWKMFAQALACCQAFIPSQDGDITASEPSLLDPWTPGGCDDNFDRLQQRDRNQGHQSESQLHKSIYWTCFKSELELRLELSMTESGPWNLRYPTFFPEPPTSLHSHGEAAWYFYLAEIALRRLKNRVMTTTCQYHGDRLYSAEGISTIVEFEKQADRWFESLPERLKGPHTSGNSDPGAAADADGEENAALRFILEGHLIDCYEMMYWPFVAEAIAGHLRDDSQSARLFATRGFQLCVRRVEQNEMGFRYRHHGAWLMLRSCTRSALVLVAAARAGFHDTLPPGWETSVDKVMEMLGYWRDEAPDAADRLDVLEQLMAARS